LCWDQDLSFTALEGICHDGLLDAPSNTIEDIVGNEDTPSLSCALGNPEEVARKARILGVGSGIAPTVLDGIGSPEAKNGITVGIAAVLAVGAINLNVDGVVLFSRSAPL
jgi:hypothetical protein